MNHDVWPRGEEGPGHCLISKRLLCVYQQNIIIIIIIIIIIYELVYRNNLSACQPCCYHQGPLRRAMLMRNLRKTDKANYDAPREFVRSVSFFVTFQVRSLDVG